MAGFKDTHLAVTHLDGKVTHLKQGLMMVCEAQNIPTSKIYKPRAEPRPWTKELEELLVVGMVKGQGLAVIYNDGFSDFTLEALTKYAKHLRQRKPDLFPPVKGVIGMHWTIKEKQILLNEVDQGQLYPEIVKKHFPHQSVERARQQVQSLQRLYPGKRESEILELLVQEHGNLDPGITPSASEIPPTGNSVESQQNRRPKSKWTAADSQKLLKEVLKGYTIRINAEQLFPGWNAENVKEKLRLSTTRPCQKN